MTPAKFGRHVNVPSNHNMLSRRDHYLPLIAAQRSQAGASRHWLTKKEFGTLEQPKKELYGYKEAYVNYEISEDVCDLRVWRNDNPGKEPSDFGFTIETPPGSTSQIVVMGAKPGYAKRRPVKAQGM